VRRSFLCVTELDYRRLRLRGDSLLISSKSVRTLHPYLISEYEYETENVTLVTCYDTTKSIKLLR
jgi:hypothetical protein